MILLLSSDIVVDVRKEMFDKTENKEQINSMLYYTC